VFLSLLLTENLPDSALVILMRASASLFPYVVEAESKSIPLRVPWVDLGNCKVKDYLEKSFENGQVQYLAILMTMRIVPALIE